MRKTALILGKWCIAFAAVHLFFLAGLCIVEPINAREKKDEAVVETMDNVRRRKNLNVFVKLHPQ